MTSAAAGKRGSRRPYLLLLAFQVGPGKRQGLRAGERGGAREKKTGGLVRRPRHPGPTRHGSEGAQTRGTHMGGGVAGEPCEQRRGGRAGQGRAGEALGHSGAAGEWRGSEPSLIPKKGLTWAVLGSQTHPTGQLRTQTPGKRE